jgi:hypothetical protein
MHYTVLQSIQIKTAKTIITVIHKNKHKNNPIQTIIHYYRRPSTNKNIFIQEMHEMINKINTLHPTPITLQGVGNMDIRRMSNKFLDFLIGNNLYTTITTITRQDPVHKTGTILDPLMTTLAETEITAGTVSPPITQN